jgi:hypothetical protein
VWFGQERTDLAQKRDGAGLRHASAMQGHATF